LWHVLAAPGIRLLSWMMANNKTLRFTAFLFLLGVCISACDPASATVDVFVPSPVFSSTTITLPVVSNTPKWTATGTPEDITATQFVASPSPDHTITPISIPYFVYITQPGDILESISRRFGIILDQIHSPEPLSGEGFLDPGQMVFLPVELLELEQEEWLLPDSEIVYGPSAIDFDVAAYLDAAGGFLKSHREYLKSTKWTSAAEIINRVARETSVNPRLLLSLLEYHCQCVTNQPDSDVDLDYLLGNSDFRRKGLFRQLSWAASQLSVGYYGWRSGDLTEYERQGQNSLRPAPGWNAGSAALLHYFKFFGESEKMKAAELSNLHGRMFGDPWARDQAYGSLFPPGFRQPDFLLPFESGRVWAFTSGPHVVWETEGALAALDFAPATHESGCVSTDAWVTSVADGVIVRTEYGAVIQDLDSVDGTPADGHEQTGWVILYMHVESRDQSIIGTRLQAGDRIGHPSCEGGRATGTHLHIARKYNGEWISAAGALPFNFEGWIAQAGSVPYEGTLVRDDQVVIARPYGSYVTKIFRPTVTPASAGQ